MASAISLATLVLRPGTQDSRHVYAPDLDRTEPDSVGHGLARTVPPVASLCAPPRFP